METGATRIQISGTVKDVAKVPDIKDFFYHPWLGGEIRHVRECLLDGLTESPILPLQRSVDLAQLMETSIRLIGGRVNIIE